MKIERHSKIVELIGKYDIETQEELAEKLNEAGFRVTQATVSRDIRELKLTKVATDGGRQKYVVLHKTDSSLNDKYIRILRAEYSGGENRAGDGHGGGGGSGRAPIP